MIKICASSDSALAISTRCRLPTLSVPTFAPTSRLWIFSSASKLFRAAFHPLPVDGGQAETLSSLAHDP